MYDDDSCMAALCMQLHVVRCFHSPTFCPSPSIHPHTQTRMPDPCQVEFCVVMRYPTDIAEDSCFPFCTALQQAGTNTGHRTARPDSASSGGGRRVLGANVHVASNSVHSHPEDSFEQERSILAISDVVRVNIHPQQSSSRSFNVFS